jgi:hypothetical protein
MDPVFASPAADSVAASVASSADPASASPVAASASPGPATLTAPAPHQVRDPWAPPSLVAAREAPLVPGARALAEFAHPAAGVIGLGFWLGFTLIHARVLGWIGFAMAAATACAGLAWFAANNRAARQAGSDGPAPSFTPRFVALHGSGAALTVALAALTALLLRP